MEEVISLDIISTFWVAICYARAKKGIAKKVTICTPKDSEDNRIVYHGDQQALRGFILTARESCFEMLERKRRTGTTSKSTKNALLQFQ